MTISTIEYALMAGASYRSTRDDINRIPYPYNFGWRRFKPEKNLDHVVGTAGFEARSYIKGSEIVISYAGTYFPQRADLVADISLGTGFAHEQFSQISVEI